MPKRCVIYCRVSTAEQAAPGRHSLDAQERLCRRHAEHQSLEIVEVLRDEGYSGRTTRRPGLRRLLEYTSADARNPIDTILVQDTSRMGRDTTEYLLFRRDLRERGIELVAVTQPNIDSSPEGRLVDTIMAGINQYQSEEKGRRVVIAMHKKFEDGWWPSTAPLGYRNVAEDSRTFVEPDPERFELLQRAFTEYATGEYTQEQLRTWLTKAGLRNRRGGVLSRGTLNKLLANPFYWGLLRWAGEMRPGKHTPLVDRAMWERCQAVTAAHNHYVSRRRKHQFFLTGLTRCGRCGHRHTQTANRRKNKRYYSCPSRARCPERYIPEDHLEAQVAARIHGIELASGFIEAVIGRVRDIFARRASASEGKRRSLLRRKALAEQKRDTAEQKLVNGVLSDEAFRRVMPEIEDELDAISRELDQVEKLRRVDTYALREVLVVARDIPAAYNRANPALRRQYVTFFFEEFIVKDRRIVRGVPTPFFESLLRLQQVQTTACGRPLVNTNLTEIGWVERLLEEVQRLRPLLVGHAARYTHSPAWQSDAAREAKEKPCGKIPAG